MSEFKSKDDTAQGESETMAAVNIVTLSPWRRNAPVTLLDAVPYLRSIWRDDLADIAAVHIRQWETDPAESGNILIASAGGAIVGITGWYRMSPRAAGLRWHGVVPEARKRGYSRQMIELACNDMPGKIRHVYEVTRNLESRDAFCRCGFEVMTDPKVIRRAVEDAEYDIDAGGWVLRKSR
jgi:GNAT superfamily N-acetyltransferase